MITSSREAGLATKQEDNATDGKISKASSSSTSRSRLKDPRIVRVSHLFGGKDRHSKVFTVRGLRDRRVRLSVPTAIQLYDLQERLGFNQPSKVVDWLINAAKHDIDKLPPLHMPPGFGLNYQQRLTSHGVSAQQSDKEGLQINRGINWDNSSLELSRSNLSSSDAMLRGKSKEIVREADDDKKNWMKRNEEGIQGDLEGHGTYASSSNFLPRSIHSSLPGLLNNVLPYNPFFRWDSSNLSLSQLGSHGMTPQPEDFHNFNVVQLPSTLSMPPASQVLVYPPGTTQTYFPSHVTSAMESDPKQMINFQMLSSSSQNPLSNYPTHPLYSMGQFMSPFHLSMASKFLPSQDNSANEPNKDNDQFPPK